MAAISKPTLADKRNLVFIKSGKFLGYYFAFIQDKEGGPKPTLFSLLFFSRPYGVVVTLLITAVVNVVLTRDVTGSPM
jgi:hypothetical protein